MPEQAAWRFCHKCEVMFLAQIARQVFGHDQPNEAVGIHIAVDDLNSHVELRNTDSTSA